MIEFPQQVINNQTSLTKKEKDEDLIHALLLPSPSLPLSASDPLFKFHTSNNHNNPANTKSNKKRPKFQNDVVRDRQTATTADHLQDNNSNPHKKAHIEASFSSSSSSSSITEAIAAGGQEKAHRGRPRKSVSIAANIQCANCRKCNTHRCSFAFQTCAHCKVCPAHRKIFICSYPHQMMQRFVIYHPNLNGVDPQEQLQTVHGIVTNVPQQQDDAQRMQFEITLETNQKIEMNVDQLVQAIVWEYVPPENRNKFYLYLLKQRVVPQLIHPSADKMKQEREPKEKENQPTILPDSKDLQQEHHHHDQVDEDDNYWVVEEENGVE